MYCSYKFTEVLHFSIVFHGLPRTSEQVFPGDDTRTSQIIYIYIVQFTEVPHSSCLPWSSEQAFPVHDDDTGLHKSQGTFKFPVAWARMAFFGSEPRSVLWMSIYIYRMLFNIYKIPSHLHSLVYKQNI